MTEANPIQDLKGRVLERAAIDKVLRPPATVGDLRQIDRGPYDRPAKNGGYCAQTGAEAES